MRLALLLSALISLAAAERAQLSGVITDASDAVLQDATITAVNEDTGIRRSCRSGATGEYAVGALPAGTYKVTVRKPGFQTIARLNVRLNPADNARLDFTMQVGSMREVVTIQGSPPLLNAEDAAVDAYAGRELIDALPLNGRGVLSIVALSPGVVATPATLGEAGQFSAGGQRPNANYFTVDGVSANTGVSGSAEPAQFSGTTLPAMTAFGGSQALASTDAIQDVRVQTSSFAPEFGRAPGANIGITTRSGTNELHGSAFYAGRNSALDANDWFANAAGLNRAPSSLNGWGAAAGGPLRKDRTFFFADYEGLRLMQPYTWRAALPSLASRLAAPALVRPLLNAFPMPTGPSLGAGLAAFTANASRPSALDSGSLRIDHALTSRMSAFARLQVTPSSSESGFAQVDHASFGTSSITVGVAALATPNITSDFRLNMTRTNVTSRWTQSNAGGAVPVDLSTVFPKPAAGGAVLYGFALAGVGQILSGEASRSSQGQWNAIETLAWNRNAHAVRWGADYNRITPSRDRVASSVAGTYQSISDVLAGRPMLLSSSVADQASSLIETLSIFAQDTWRIAPRLNATYGVRWELTPAPSYRSSGPPLAPSQTLFPSAPPAAPLWPARYSQLAPRIGIAYRLAPATILRAGWGIFYDVNFAVATDPINAFPYNRWQFAPTFPGAALPANAPYTGNAFAPGLKLPYSREWNLALEHAFGNTDVVTASYIGSAGRNLLRREAEFDPAPSEEHAQNGPRPALPNREFLFCMAPRDRGLCASSVAIAPTATNHGRADYHALQLQYRRKFSQGLQGLASYTWSHSLDNGSWDSGIYLPVMTARDRGPSAFDARHNFSAGLSWALSGFARHWTVSSFVSARCGFPIEVLASENLLGLGFDDFQRPDLVPGVPVWLSDPSSPGGRRLNPAAFVIPVSRTAQGSLGRDSITGFGLAQMDVALQREFTIREEAAIDLRVEAFNIANHAQFGDPVRFLTSPLFGQSVSMLNLMLGSGTPHSGVTPAFQPGGPRTLQVTIRLRFETQTGEDKVTFSFW